MTCVYIYIICIYTYTYTYIYTIYICIYIYVILYIYICTHIIDIACPAKRKDACETSFYSTMYGKQSKKLTYQTNGDPNATGV